MKRIALVCALCLAALLLPLSAGAAGTVTVSINGTPVAYNDSYGYPFVDAAGRTQVPFRRTMETFGCTVSWNGWTDTQYRDVVIEDDSAL